MAQGATTLLIEKLEAVAVDIEDIERLIASEPLDTSDQLLALRTIQELYRRLADDRGRLCLIDGLRMREVGRASDSHEGKRCARYDQSFHHGNFPLGKRKQGSDLLTFPYDNHTPRP